MIPCSVFAFVENWQAKTSYTEEPARHIAPHLHSLAELICRLHAHHRVPRSVRYEKTVIQVNVGGDIVVEGDNGDLSALVAELADDIVLDAAVNSKDLDRRPRVVNPDVLPRDARDEVLGIGVLQGSGRHAVNLDAAHDRA